MLTIELDPQNRAVQVRGFSNRVALPDERKIIERWAKARSVCCETETKAPPGGHATRGPSF
ncbi:hypothetical protein AJ88_23045 [Mesorhizobium amorphae CCBAU 01583]|nr:hypothetical protein AJ88_23045 [Mesorhizobium amorphae CCBAU 01583]